MQAVHKQCKQCKYCKQCTSSASSANIANIAGSAQAVQVLQILQAVHKQAPAAKWAAHWRAARTKSAHNLYCSALSFIAIGGWILCRLRECCITGSHHRNGPTPVQQPLPVRLSDLSEGLPGWYNLHLYLYTLPCVSKPRPCLKVRTTLRAQSFKGIVKFNWKTRPSILCVTQKRAFMPLYIVLGQ